MISKLGCMNVLVDANDLKLRFLPCCIYTHRIGVHWAKINMPEGKNNANFQRHKFYLNNSGGKLNIITNSKHHILNHGHNKDCNINNIFE